MWVRRYKKTVKSENVTDFQGRKIKCPICRSEEVELRANKQGKPLVYCPRFGDCFNFNSRVAIRYIERLLGEEKEEAHISPRRKGISLDLDR